MYILGFICALAVSRVRVSSIIVFPACAFVFAVGFSTGIVNGGKFNELSLFGNKKRSKDEIFRGFTEKLVNLLDFFDGFDRKIKDFKFSIGKGIESKHVTVDDLENYVKVVESIGLSSLKARSVVRDCIDSISIENVETEKSNKKTSKKKKETGENGMEFFQFFGSYNSKPNKIKLGNKKDWTNLDTNDQSQVNILGPDMVHERRKDLANDFKFSELSSDSERDSGNGKNSYQGSRLRLMNSERINVKMGPYNEVETWSSSDNFLDSMNFRIDSNTMEAETFRKQEQIFGKINGNNRPRHNFDDIENDIYRPYNKENEETDEDSFPSSSVSNDIIFNEYLMEATTLLKEAREYLRVKSDEKKVETLLYNAAKLFSKAIDMKPMSLLGVGQLGNTYLLHGEIKLKKSRRLRALLAENDELSVKRRGQLCEGIDDPFEKRDRIASLLIRVCEECEELLVKAGKKYGLALSIDGNDMRAMYNWGLALSLRAQLIADIGPEAAFDADKVFLAAIDKFDAMMSKSNAYAPDALFRWGVALQQRSRLRPRNKNEKVKLLQQAKRLYEDALDMDSDNLQVREALGSCINELDFRSY